ncbi:MAG: polyhydroxyalkanoate synthesis regulator DNA-binding domain-containing protein [Opitutaceae bacterium]
MGDSKTKDKSGEGPVEIRKYPNRRYYNTRESRHITLQEICDLVRDGHDIRVTDSKSGEDITGAVLTQILLELESPKLAFFPVSLLQHLIRINTGFLDHFTESYFRQAFASFGLGGKGWPGGFGVGAKPPAMPGTAAWADLFGGFFPGARPESEPAPVPDELRVDDPAGDSVADLRDEIEALHRKLEKLEKRGNRAK